MAVNRFIRSVLNGAVSRGTAEKTRAFALLMAAAAVVLVVVDDGERSLLVAVLPATNEATPCRDVVASDRSKVMLQCSCDAWQ